MFKGIPICTVYTTTKICFLQQYWPGLEVRVCVNKIHCIYVKYMSNEVVHHVSGEGFGLVIYNLTPLFSTAYKQMTSFPNCEFVLLVITKTKMGCLMSLDRLQPRPTHYRKWLLRVTIVHKLGKVHTNNKLIKLTLIGPFYLSPS